MFDPGDLSGISAWTEQIRMETALLEGAGLSALEAVWELPTREERAGPCAYLAWVDSLPTAEPSHV
jgi:hypothetical protein